MQKGMTRNRRISESTVRRLSIYYRLLSTLEKEGSPTVSSRELAEREKLTPAQVRKDVTAPEGYTELDLTYVEASRTWSSARLVRYDLGILWQTVRVLARGEGLQY